MFFDKKLSVPIIVAVVKVKIVGPFCSMFFFLFKLSHDLENVAITLLQCHGGVMIFSMYYK